MIVSMTFGYQMCRTQITFNMLQHLVHPPANEFRDVEKKFNLLMYIIQLNSFAVTNLLSDYIYDHFRSISRPC